ncbi:MAG TPA: hypothetical protein VF697_27255, partial [Archangium sp.]
MNAHVPTGNELAHLLRRVSSSPAEARRLVSRAVGITRAQLVLRRCELGRNVYVGGDLHCDAEGHVTIGDRVCFFDGMLTSELRCHAGAQLSIGEQCTFNYGFFLEAHHRIRIGRRC